MHKAHYPQNVIDGFRRDVHAAIKDPVYAIIRKWVTID